VYPIHQISGKAANERKFQETQKKFKSFLDNTGADLSKTAEFLPFYALPYVPNPKEHPSFKNLFVVEWIQDLVEKIRTYSEEVTSKMEDGPLLMKIFSSYANKLDKGDDAESVMSVMPEDQSEQI
jgi:hypothetical protein